MIKAVQNIASFVKYLDFIPTKEQTDALEHIIKKSIHLLQERFITNKKLQEIKDRKTDKYLTIIVLYDNYERREVVK